MPSPEPIFILASPRSYTSLVCAMLGQHPDAYAVPEINLLITATLEQLMEHGRAKRAFMIHGLLRTIAQLYAGEQTIESIQMARRWIHKRLEHKTSTVYWELCDRVAPLRIVDKSPAYSKNLRGLGYLHETFPNASYLYLTRHPREQGKSVMKAPQAVATLVAADSIDYSINPPIIDPQYAWYRRQRKILEFLSTIPKARQLQVQGEELCNDPRGQLQRICQWLNFSWDDAIYESMLRTQDSSYACMGPYGAQWGNNPGFQSSPAFRYRPVPPSQLAGALPWRSDGGEFISDVVAVAHELGYD